MNHIQIFALTALAAFLVGCESTEQTGQGNAEVKRAALLKEREQEEAQMDEAQKNLWNAHQDRLNRDGNPIGQRTP